MARTAHAIEILRQHGRMSGRDLRNAVSSSLGFRISLATFYLMMADLEEAAEVFGEWEEVLVEGHPVRVRYYRLGGF